MRERENERERERTGGRERERIGVSLCVLLYMCVFTANTCACKSVCFLGAVSLFPLFKHTLFPSLKNLGFCLGREVNVVVAKITRIAYLFLKGRAPL